ncbi:MAG: glucose-6-phosphate isomerase [Dorea sp.]|nr:glucose-6-phosphate isomerase [Dorea sp.]
MELHTGFDLQADLDTLDFRYGTEAFGPVTEKRKLDDIRGSLSNPEAEGPEIVYSVAMDVGKLKDKDDLIKRNLLFGAMIFEKGIIGEEPVRSQGHVHAVSESCHASTCEVYEIWNGAAYIYMQEHDADDPGRCFAVYAKAGEVVIVPPGWAHCTINANINEPMLFGAWCVRDYGFDYEGIRAHNGVAYFPKVRNGRIEFVKNGRYSDSGLEIVSAGGYQEFGLEKGVPIYTQYEKNKDLFRFVTDPACAGELWEGYRP